jgi:hypothetical protein
VLPRTSRQIALTRRLCTCAMIGIASGANAQEDTSAGEEVERIQQEYQDQLRRSRLVGSDDDLAIEMPNGDLIHFRDRPGCMQPVSRGGLIKVDCTILDGPAYYFNETTRAMVEVCSFWFPDPDRCPPKQWPMEVPECDGRVPQNITGTWRLYAMPTAGGFSLVGGGWTITLTDELMLFDVEGPEQLERSYSIIEQTDQRYSLEIRDERNARTAVDVELAPCGLFIESEAVCDEFCQNYADEVGVPTDEQIREIATRMGGDQSDESLERFETMIRESIEQGPRIVFPERAFFIGEIFQ